MTVPRGAGRPPEAMSDSQMLRRDRLAVTLMLFFALPAIALSIMPVVTPDLQARYSLSASQIGLLTSVFMFAYAASAIPAGLATSRFGGQVLGASCALLVVGSAIFSVSASMAGFVVGRILQGLGGGMVTVACNATLANALPPERVGRAWGILGAGWGIGTLIALLLLPSVTETLGFEGAFWTSASITLAVGAVALAQKEVRIRPCHDHQPKDVRALGRNLATVALDRRVVLIGVLNAAGIAAGVGVRVWTPPFLQAEYGTSLAVSAYLTAGLGAAQLVGNPLGAMSAARWGKLRVIVGSLVGLTAVSIFVPLAPGLWAVFAAVLAVGFLSMFCFAPLVALISEVVVPEQVGPATGYVNVLGYAGSLAAPWLFGALLDAGKGYLAGYLLLAAFPAVGTLAAALFRGSPRMR